MCASLKPFFYAWEAELVGLKMMIDQQAKMWITCYRLKRQDGRENDQMDPRRRGIPLEPSREYQPMNQLPQDS